jgi:hypothetical protein
MASVSDGCYCLRLEPHKQCTRSSTKSHSLIRIVFDQPRTIDLSPNLISGLLGLIEVVEPPFRVALEGDGLQSTMYREQELRADKYFESDCDHKLFGFDPQGNGW